MMLDLNSMPKIEEFTYWFIPESDGYGVISLSDYTHVVRICGSLESGYSLKLDDHASSPYDVNKILNEFEKFRSSPEFLVGKQLQGNVSFESAVDFYETVLAGVLMLRACVYMSDRNPDRVISNVQKILDWIRSTDFYYAPSSTRFHDAYEHGLLYHTIQVVNNITDLIKIPKFKSVDMCSAILVALVHDWCKIGLYESYKRNVKDENTGVWNQVDAYRRKDASMPFGHGVQSLYIANKMFDLSLDEALAIRWHMGVWNVCDMEQNDLQQANEQYPLVHLLQFADQLAITKY